jgi:hypothetical protein
MGVGREASNFREELKIPFSKSCAECWHVIAEARVTFRFFSSFQNLNFTFGFIAMLRAIAAPA